MKTKITCILMALFIMVSATNAAEINVTNADEFNNAWLSYEAGDVIVLAEGTYTFATGGDKSVTRSVTIKAASNATTKPELKGLQFIFNDVCSFSVDGIKASFDEPGAATPTGKYFVQTVSTGIAAGTIPLISIKNSEIHGYGRGLIRADNGTNIATITSLVIENCFIWDMGRNSVGYSTIGLKTAKIAGATIKNTTFFDSPNGTWNAEQVLYPVNLLMENCNIIKTTTAASKLIITNKTNPGSTYTIRNCIIAGSQDATTDRMQIKIADLADDVTSATHIENSILYGFKTPKIMGTLNTNTEVEVTDLAYNQTAWTITTTPATVGFIGDPRWTVNGITSNRELNTGPVAFGRIEKGTLSLYQLPENARVEVFTLNGTTLHSVQASSFVSLQLNQSMAIVRIISDEKTEILKVIQ
jgi:hypothetical protein